MAIREGEARAHGDERNLNAAHGRRERDSSPMRVKRPCCAARRPLSMRMVEPELPQSSGASDGVTRPATPVTSIAPGPRVVTQAPSWLMQARVEAQSAPVEKLVKREVPAANAPSMAYL